MIEQLNFYCEPGWAVGLIGASFLAGIIVGTLTLTRLGDILGRKPVYMLGVFMHVGFTMAILMSYNAYLDYALVFIFGLSSTARYYVGFSYLLEI